MIRDAGSVIRRNAAALQVRSRPSWRRPRGRPAKACPHHHPRLRPPSLCVIQLSWCMGCVFCQISSGEAAGSFVYEDDQVFGIMSLDQPNAYKVLVVPREHVESLYDLSEEQAARIFQATVKIARAVRDVSGCEGLNLVQSNGLAAQQDVFHFHMHLVPRSHGDTVVLRWDNVKAGRAELDRMAEQIRSNLDRQIS